MIRIAAETGMDFTRSFPFAGVVHRQAAGAGPGGTDLPMDRTIIEYEQIRPEIRRKR